MIALISQKDFRKVQNLQFCYLCGNEFVDSDEINRDHIPPQKAFLSRDREPLWLPTHKACNSRQQLDDEKIGQLIALRYGKQPKSEVSRLQFAVAPKLDKAALLNLHVDKAIARWVRGFHAALYGEAAGRIRGNVGSPFPRFDIVNGKPISRDFLDQHAAFVKCIKNNRARNNIDRIVSNKGKMTYECVWEQDDKKAVWMCIYALDIYGWKDLGRTNLAPARGCVGFYRLESNTAPESASKGKKFQIEVPNYDELDPFGK